MFVTEVQAVTKQKYRIVIEGQPAFVLYKGELFRYKIEKEKEIPEEVYRELIEKVLTRRAKLRAMHLLERMDRTRAELEEKLRRSEYPSEAIEAAMAYVESYGYINDRRYAAHYVEQKKAGKGKARLKMELLRKGVDREIIDEVLEECCQEDCHDTIMQLIDRKRSGKGPMDDKEKRRLYGFLMRKGFSSSEVLSALKEKDDFC